MTLQYSEIERNGIIIRIATRQQLDQAGWTDQQIRDWNLHQIDNSDLYILSARLTFGEICQFVLGEQTYDLAMPTGQYQNGHVWLYNPSDYFGKPFDVMSAFWNEIKEFCTVSNLL